MESKLDTAAMHLTRKGLLIEPVWNRNMPLIPNRLIRLGTFNRTSMESKLDTVQVSGLQLSTFNRTSMESKLDFWCIKVKN